jgi:hypothetical protein
MKLNLIAKAGLACAALSIPVQASAETCVTAKEAQSIMAAVMPDLLDSIIKQCKPSLTESGFFGKSGAAMVGRYKTSADANWPMARKAFAKMSGDSASQKMMDALPDDMVRSLISIGMASALADGIKPEQCGNVEQLAAALEPLPPENMATAFGVIMQLSGGKAKAGRKGAGFTICPANSASTASK